MAEALTNGALDLVELGSLDHKGFIGADGQTVTLMYGRGDQLGPILMEHAPPHVFLVSAVGGVTLFEDGVAKIGVYCNLLLHLRQSGPPELIGEHIRGGLGSMLGV